MPGRVLPLRSKSGDRCLTKKDRSATLSKEYILSGRYHPPKEKGGEERHLKGEKVSLHGGRGSATERPIEFLEGLSLGSKKGGGEGTPGGEEERVVIPSRTGDEFTRHAFSYPGILSLLKEGRGRRGEQKRPKPPRPSGDRKNSTPVYPYFTPRVSSSEKGEKRNETKEKEQRLARMSAHHFQGGLARRPRSG